MTGQSAPAGLGGYPINGPLQTDANTCSQTGQQCGDLQTGVTSSCHAYPAYASDAKVIASVAYSMWQSAPGVCDYAMGIVASRKIVW